MTMPAEWGPHERTWMAFPTPNATFGEPGTPSLEQARAAWARVANTLVGYEPVTVVAGPGQTPAAREVLRPDVDIVEFPLDDAWMRDIGPTFVRRAGTLTAVDWTFNGWGGQDWAQWTNDREIARSIAALTRSPVSSSTLTNEGGGLHVDGEGTVLLTETVQLDPGRNPGWTKAEVEAEIHAQLGTTTAIWLPRGLTRDYDEFGTRGHVDMVASFLRPGVVAVHTQPDPTHPDHTVCHEIAQQLRASIDARGRVIEVVELPAPTIVEEDGLPAGYSYVNHYVANGVVIACAFDDTRDATAAEVLARAYPGRVVEQVDARGIFRFGGGIHCITQQQPSAG